MEKKERTELEEQRDQFTVVLEDIHSHNRVFGEMLLSVRDDVSVLKEDVSTLKFKVNNLENRFDRLETKVDATFEEVGRLREDITVMNEIKADKSDMEALDTRITHLEIAR